MEFKLVSKFKPKGDQPQAIRELVKKLKAGVKRQTLLGVTGSGKTFSMAKVIEKTQKPALIISPNKTLAAQLYQEFKEFFPNNAVHYFVSYYDYYQPEAYIPQTDTYIEKDAKINEEIDRLRHAATQDLLTRNDVIIVASVSCIYNIGSPEAYQNVSLELKRGQRIKRNDLLYHLIALQYQRSDIDFKPGTFRVRGDLIEAYLVTGQKILKIELAGDKIISDDCRIFPAHFWVTPKDKVEIAIENIKLELQERLSELKKQGKLPEAQRLAQKTNFDLEMLRENGYCHGIENYSRHMEFREPGQAPHSLLDYYPASAKATAGKPKDFLIFIDESHITLPQLRAMAVQDRARKKTLIEYGFRLPSAIDNRPLNFKEFEQRSPQTIYVSATPGEYEKRNPVAEQLIRPTGLLEPKIEVRPTRNQVGDLIAEIKKTSKKKQRSLVLTLTKKLAEALSDHLTEQGVKTSWLHSEVKTLERPAILKDLREGKYDVLVGVNLLREGLDLPEVSLVVILDADKEGFLRNETTLIQTMGRAARHPSGRVILYADKKTFSMKNAIKEVWRRRKIQEDYNREHKIAPQPITKEIRQWLFFDSKDNENDLLQKQLKKAAKDLDLEGAAKLRSLLKKIT